MGQPFKCGARKAPWRHGFMSPQQILASRIHASTASWQILASLGPLPQLLGGGGGKSHGSMDPCLHGRSSLTWARHLGRGPGKPCGGIEPCLHSRSRVLCPPSKGGMARKPTQRHGSTSLSCIWGSLAALQSGTAREPPGSHGSMSGEWKGG